MRYKKQSLTTIMKHNDNYIVTKSEYMGINLSKPRATYDFSTEIATFYGYKITARNVDVLYKATKAYYTKRFKWECWDLPKENTILVDIMA